MAGRIGSFLKDAWAKEPVIVASCGIALAAVILPLLSPYRKYSDIINSKVPYTYPVPVRDDGNMPDIPRHPCDPQGDNLEWVKKL